jgi:hypothetical protein
MSLVPGVADTLAVIDAPAMKFVPSEADQSSVPNTSPLATKAWVPRVFDFDLENEMMPSAAKALLYLNTDSPGTIPETE